jgi:heme/copper-type cytochrome/quinol oxidase subunit 2
MKKIIILASLFLLCLPFFVSAGDSIKIDNPLAYKSFDEIINAVINFIFWVGLAVTPLMIVIAGFMILTARDDASKVEQGRKIIIYTMVGLFIILFAKGLISVLNQVMGVKKPS